MDEARYVCPVCGYPELDCPAYDEHECSRFDICPCCGIQFGYDDATRSHNFLRVQWLAKGAKWHSTAYRVPEKWSAAQQLESAELDITADKESWWWMEWGSNKQQMSSGDRWGCRVCGLLLDEPPWGQAGDEPSFRFCPCCGTEFGFTDDSSPIIRYTRSRWLKNGAEWFKVEEKPVNWDLNAQINNISNRWRMIPYRHL